MKRHRLLKYTFTSPIYAQLGGHHFAETMPVMYGNVYKQNLNVPKPQNPQVATRIRLSKGKPKKFFK